ncbi:hypothetical protein [uncultured Algimonas sp.]|uniref:hypothetical protein n=1 Tax=uncultured Algimonas sp. TaxID=1547920 RepID=UPI002629A99C|nr:hypothetical protein [uncultured Algimonas sp.]
MRWDWLALGGVIVVLFIALLTQRPNPDLLRFEVEGERAYGYGFTDGRSQGVVDRLRRDHPDVDTLVFVDMPGTRDVTSNYRLARDIRRAGLNTELRPDSRIASGAVDLFLAGTERIVACGAMVGVHAWGGAGFDAQDAVWDTHRRHSRGFLSDMGIDPDFYDFRTQAAGTDEMHWLSADEIERWRVATAPVDCR